MQPGQHVLILGATGVTGSMAVQLAKSVFGAGRVTVTGRNESPIAAGCAAASADEAISISDAEVG